MRKLWDNLPPQINVQKSKFYWAGYLRGISFPPQKKSSRRDEVSAHTVTFPKIVSQNAPDCISAHIHFKKFPGQHAPGPPTNLVAFGHSGLLPQTINPR